MTTSEYYLICLNVFLLVLMIILCRGIVKINRELVATKSFVGILFEFIDETTEDQGNFKTNLKLYLEKKLNK